MQGKYEWMTDVSEQIKRNEAKDAKTIKMLGYTCTLGIAVAVIGVMVFSCTEAVVRTAENQERYYSQPVQFTAEQEEYRDFFRRHGSPVPEQMAVAVTATKRPALMAAIAVKESNGTPTAIGDNGDSKGAFQVQEKHWGPVSDSPVQQALQAERILEALVESRGNLRRGLTHYNGGTQPPRVSYQYADGVVRLAQEVR